MNKVEVYKKARELVANGWTRGAMARDSKGRPSGYDTPESTCFCSAGAIYAATYFFRIPIYYKNGDFISMFIETNGINASGVYAISGIAEWNDDPQRTQADVITAFDKVIEASK